MERGMRRTMTGTVVSDKMEKTVVVAVDSYIKHSVYNKVMKRTKKYKAHDGENACKTGDKVRIMETRPVSKEKCWRVVQIIEKAPLL